MSSSIKVSAAWKQITGASVKVSGTWRTVNAAYVKVGGVWKQWFAAFITDNFNRSTSGTLGTSSSGATWTTQRGNWYANGGAAQSDDSASNYSHASVGWGPASITASASVTGGTGITFWVSNANSWWAVVSYNTSSSYTYGTGAYSCNCQTCGTTSCNTCANPVCGSTTTYDCGSGGSGTIIFDPGGVGCTYNGQICYSSYLGGGIWGVYYCGAVTSYGTCANCYYCGGTDNTYQCNCQTCYTGSATGYSYNYYLRLLKSENGTISLATSDINIGSQAAAISVVINGNDITAKAYSDTGMASQLGSTLSYTAVSPVKGQSVGIIKAPSDYSQGSTVDNFSVSL